MARLGGEGTEKVDQTIGAAQTCQVSEAWESREDLLPSPIASNLSRACAQRSTRKLQAGGLESGTAGCLGYTFTFDLA